MKKGVLMLFILLLLSCGNRGVVENAYRTFNDWKNDSGNVIKPPRFIPEKAQQIKEIHHKEMQLMYGVYSYGENPVKEKTEVTLLTTNAFILELHRVASFRPPGWFLNEKAINKGRDMRVYQTGTAFIIDLYREKKAYFITGIEKEIK
jgi:hypothetical protein